MPLMPGKSDIAISKNIREMRHAGHPQDQAVAAAMDMARRTRAMGGAMKNPKVHSGPINVAIPGRTDRLPVHVYSGSYVLPADIVSGLGEGNTLAGNDIVKRMIADGGFGQKWARNGGRQLFDRYGLQGYYHGGHAHVPFSGDPKAVVPVIVAGGEYIITPEEVMQIGEGDLNKGHAVLDAFVKSQRRLLIKTLGKLPGPARD